MFPKPVCQHLQLVDPLSLSLIHITSGAFDKPCPIEAELPLPVYCTIENPAVVFAWTVEVIAPLPLLAVVPPFATQFHDTKELPEVLTLVPSSSDRDWETQLLDFQ